MKYTITIPKPCHEKWDLMTPTEKGKFCGSCQKEVMDFTNISNFQLASILDKGGNVCGRFRENQLNKQISSPRSTHLHRTGLAFGIGSLLSLCNPAHSQEQTTAIENVSAIGEPLAITKIETQKLFGTVTDQDGLPLPGVNITIEKTDIGTQTDFDGNFEIQLPNQFEKEQRLKFEYVGQKTQILTINEFKNIGLIRMEDDTEALEEVVIIAGYVVVKKKGLFSRIKNLFKRKHRLLDEKEKDKTAEVISKTNQYDKPAQPLEKTSSVILWPNPVVNELNINYKLDTSSDVSITLLPLNKISQENRLIFSRARGAGSHSEQVDTSKIPPGIYSLLFETNQVVETHKVIIQ